MMRAVHEARSPRQARRQAELLRMRLFEIERLGRKVLSGRSVEPHALRQLALRIRRDLAAQLAAGGEAEVAGARAERLRRLAEAVIQRSSDLACSPRELALALVNLAYLMRCALEDGFRIVM